MALVVHLYNLVVRRNYLPLWFTIFLSMRTLVVFILRIIVSHSDVTWKPFFSARVILNKFACRSGSTAVFYHIKE